MIRMTYTFDSTPKRVCSFEPLCTFCVSGALYVSDRGLIDRCEEEILILRANENTMRSEIKCAYRINFTTPNNIGSLLGYSKSRVIQPNKWYASDKPVNIMNVL